MLREWLCVALGVQIEHNDSEDGQGANHSCLVGIGRLQVTSSPNISDLGTQGNAAEFISRHSVEGKFTFIDQRYEGVTVVMSSQTFLTFVSFSHACTLALNDYSPKIGNFWPRQEISQQSNSCLCWPL